MGANFTHGGQLLPWGPSSSLVANFILGGPWWSTASSFGVNFTQGANFFHRFNFTSGGQLHLGANFTPWGELKTVLSIFPRFSAFFRVFRVFPRFPRIRVFRIFLTRGSASLCLLRGSSLIVILAATVSVNK
jgi:hypothetical protein